MRARLVLWHAVSLCVSSWLGGWGKSHFTTSYLSGFTFTLWLYIMVSVCLAYVLKKLVKYPFIIHLNGFFFSLLPLCGMVATTSTARTFTVHRKWIIRWGQIYTVKFFFVLFIADDFFFHSSVMSFHYKVHLLPILSLDIINSTIQV